jgi:hypothetical protein
MYILLKDNKTKYYNELIFSINKKNSIYDKEIIFNISHFNIRKRIIDKKILDIINYTMKLIIEQNKELKSYFITNIEFYKNDVRNIKVFIEYI